MRKLKSNLLAIALLLAVFSMRGQADSVALRNPGVMTYNEFLGYVKKFHPLVRQANLAVDRSQAYLMEARGAFDPKLEADFEQKKFKGTEYYEVLNSSFKIPTWYGIEVKAAFDRADGYYLNPEATTPDRGLTSLGVSVPLGQGLWINERMTILRQAKIQARMASAEKKLAAANILFDASAAYFEWLRAHQEARIYNEYAEAARTRHVAIKRSIELGDKAPIDSTESAISLKMRRLGLEDARLKLNKARLSLSNYLWIDSTPVELSEAVGPEEALTNELVAIMPMQLEKEMAADSNPKVQLINGKIEILEAERRFRQNQLLPNIKAGYQFLTTPENPAGLRHQDYKLGLAFSYPLFLRKERAKIRLSKIKLQDETLGLEYQQTVLRNKIAALRTEFSLLVEQRKLAAELNRDYNKMLEAEERMFALGESSLFLINNRENALLGNRLALAVIESRVLGAVAEFYRTTAEFP